MPTVLARVVRDLLCGDLVTSASSSGVRYDQITAQEPPRRDTAILHDVDQVAGSRINAARLVLVPRTRAAPCTPSCVDDPHLAARCLIAQGCRAHSIRREEEDRARAASPA